MRSSIASYPSRKFWGSLLRRALHPGSVLRAFLRRLRRPSEFLRQRAYYTAKQVGKLAAARKRELASARLNAPDTNLPAGISVVIPSRDGRDLLAELLPIIGPMLKGADAEIIVVDNGSSDGTGEFLAGAAVRCDVHPEPLTFAKAVNTGIAKAQYSHVLLLNNDMRPHPGFFEPLLDAFERVPDLFCATAQIFFPEGRRREETGKAVMPSQPKDRQFPVVCATPLEGEDLSPVLYGSGGCSLYDAAKLRALGMFSEIFEPAYVEDLDLGFRAWQRGWPTVYAARAHVTHHHRSTTSRFYTPGQLEHMTERNYLRFLMHSVGNPDTFQRLWSYAVERLSWKAEIEHHQPSLHALSEAKDTTRYLQPTPAADEEAILALGSGDIAIFPGRVPRNPNTPIVLNAAPDAPFPMRRAIPKSGQVLITFVDELHTPPPELLDICLEIVYVRRSPSHAKADAFRAALGHIVHKWKPAIAHLEAAQMAAYSPLFSSAGTSIRIFGAAPYVTRPT